MTKDKSTPQPSPLLFVHYGQQWIRGSERCLLDLLSHIDREKFTPILWCNQSLLADEAQGLNIQVYQTDFPLLLGWLKPRFNLIAYFKLVRQATKIIVKHRIKLIHANSAAPCQWLNSAARQSKVPLIAHLHSNYLARDRLTLGLHKVSMAVGVSHFVIKDLIADGMYRDRIRVISNGIDTLRLTSQATFNVRQLYQFAPSDFVIATVGSLILRKGVDLIIKAFARLRNNGIKAKLLIIGDGIELTNLQRQVKGLGLVHDVKFVGECRHVHGLLRGGVDLFVSGAREEAFGLVFAEASLAQLPIVAPDVGGISDVVWANKTGLLYPFEDLDAFTHAMQTLYQDKALRQSMAASGKRYILENFTIEQNVNAFEALYASVLKNPAPVLPWYQNKVFYCTLAKSLVKSLAKSLAKTCVKTCVKRLRQAVTQGVTP